MAQTLAELYVRIGSDFTKVDGDLSKLDHRIKGMDPTIQKMESGFSKVGKTIGALGGVIAGIGIVKFGSDIIGASTRMDSLNRAMITTEGSASKASARMKEFVQIAKDPGLGLTQLAKGYIQLKSVGIEAGLAIRSIRGIANAIALVGGGKEELERVTRQFVQMQGKGKVMAEDLMVIAESMPQIRKMAEQAFPAAAKSSKGLTEALQEMGVTGKQFIAGVTAEMEKMPKAADSAKNAQDNFTDSLERFRAKLGDQILPVVTDFLNNLTDLMSKFEAMPASTQKMLGKAVVGGAGLLGIAATLTSIVSTIGLVKTGLGGLGAVNVASAGAGVAAAETTQLMRPGISALGAGLGAGLTAGTIAITAATVLLSGLAIYNEIKGFNKPFITPEDAEKRIISNWQGFINKLEQQGKTQATYGAGVSVKDTFGLNKAIDLSRQAKDLGYDLDLLNSLDDVLIDMQKRLNDFQGTLYETKPLNIIGAGATEIGFESLADKAKAKFGDIQSKEYQASDAKQLAFWQSQLGTPLTPEARQGVLNTISEFQDKVNKSLKEKAEERVKFLDEINALAYPEKPPPPDIVDILGITPRSATDYEFRKEPKKREPAEYTPSIPFRAMTDAADVERKGLISGVEFGTAAQEREKSILKIAKIEKDVNDKFFADWQKGTKQIQDVWDDYADDVTYSIDEIGNKWLDTASNIASQMSSSIIDKGSGQLIDALFDESELKLAWERYQKQFALDSQKRIAMGQTESKELMMSYKQFSDNYKAQNDINKQTWKEFLSDMLKEWSKMLAKKLLAYGAEKVAEWAIDKMTKKEDMYAPDSPLLADTIPESQSLILQKGVSTQEDYQNAGWGHWYKPGGIGDWLSRDSEEDKAWKAGHIGEFASGGWIMKPTIALMGEREPELVIPKSKLGSSGLGGNTHIEIHNINVPETWDRAKIENVIVQAVTDARRHNRL